MRALYEIKQRREFPRASHPSFWKDKDDALSQAFYNFRECEAPELKRFYHSRKSILSKAVTY